MVFDEPCHVCLFVCWMYWLLEVKQNNVLVVGSETKQLQITSIDRSKTITGGPIDQKNGILPSMGVEFKTSRS